MFSPHKYSNVQLTNARFDKWARELRRAANDPPEPTTGAQRYRANLVRDLAELKAQPGVEEAKAFIIDQINQRGSAAYGFLREWVKPKKTLDAALTLLQLGQSIWVGKYNFAATPTYYLRGSDTVKPVKRRGRPRSALSEKMCALEVGQSVTTALKPSILVGAKSYVRHAHPERRFKVEKRDDGINVITRTA